MSNILITGSNGQLGSEIKNIITKNQHPDNYFFTNINDLDISLHDDVSNFISQNNIDLVVNCAAYTDVEQAESEPQKANLINNIAVLNIVKACQQSSASLIHISTDYVFSGEKNTPYSEDDAPNPVTIYGKTKLLGELAISQSDIPYIIIRTSWLYSIYGENFVKKIQRLSSQKSQIDVVFDQVGTPTHAKDLADFIIYIINNKLYTKKREVYNFSNNGVCSWFDFATEIVKLSNNNCLVTPCLSSNFPSPVSRPSYSVLNKQKIKDHFNYSVPYWRTSLKQYFNQ